MQVQWKHKHAHVIRMSIIHSYLDVYVCLHHVQSVCINNYLCQKYSLVTTHRGVSHMTVPWYSYTHQPCDSHMTDSLMIQLYTFLWDSPSDWLLPVPWHHWGCRHEDIGFHCCQDTCLEMWAAQWDLRECVCVRVCLGGRGGLNSICPVVIHLSIHPSIHLSIYPRLSLFPYLLLERCHSGQLKRLHTHSLL